MARAQPKLIVLIAGFLVAGFAGAWWFAGHAAQNPAADLNHDNSVGILDLSILLSHWNNTGAGVMGDLNADNSVGILDLSILLTSWGPVASACASGVAINTTDIAQSIVNAHPAGTTYIVKAGTHQSNFSVTPKAGDTYCGETGNVIDGGRTLVKAFQGNVNNVTLDSLVVQNYNTGWQAGAIGPVVTSANWIVRNVTSRNNYWAGLSLADGMKVLGGHYVDNDQLGISSGDPAGRDSIGALLDGVDNDVTTFDGPEMARNHCMHWDCDQEAGGMKGLSDMTIRNTYVHDNDSFGLWADINDMNTLVEYNRVENNGDA